MKKNITNTPNTENEVNNLRLTEGDQNIVERLREVISSENIVSYQFSGQQKGLMSDWYKNLLSQKPSIVDTYIAPNGRSLVDEIDMFKDFLLKEVFVGENDQALLSQLRSLSKDPSLLAVSISGFNDNPDRIFSRTYTLIG